MIQPIHRHISVTAEPERAFQLFTEQIGSWWPAERYSMAVSREDGSTVDTVVFEQREGGRVYEVASNGTEGLWATVLAWDPPHRFVLAWHPTLREEPPTEVEITFSPDGTGTRIDLEHRGWEALGDRADEAADGYEEGWSYVLGERYAQAAAGATDAATAV
jgi:uncharacterized protein YndB with AHSA1/START domain